MSPSYDVPTHKAISVLVHLILASVKVPFTPACTIHSAHYNNSYSTWWPAVLFHIGASRKKYQGLVSIQKETSYFTSMTLWYVTIRCLLRYWTNPQLLSNAGTWWLIFSLHYSYYHEYNYIIHIITNTRRNTWSRYAWLTGHERRLGCARTSIGIDSAAEVANSKCNYIILNTWADIRGFPHTFYYFWHSAGCCLVSMTTIMQGEKLQNDINIFRVKRKIEEKK